MKRRSFVKKVAVGSFLVGAGASDMFAMDMAEKTKLTILHTNDVHSRVDAFPMDDKKFGGMGGAARRMTLIKQVRAEEDHVLLLDCGDIFQGTPYFNNFGGELEFKLMSSMKYDAATLGNHDFDAGIDGLYKQLPNTNFPFLISNYDFSDTIMNKKTLPWKVFNKGGIKVGVFGIGIELKGLVADKMFKGTRYLDPVQKANETAAILKHDEQCDYVICLSHLGYKYENKSKVSDHILAQESKDINLILGGHTHTFLEKAVVAKNKNKKPVIINQAGWAGLMLGRIDLYFQKRYKYHCGDCKNTLIGGA